MEHETEVKEHLTTDESGFALFLLHEYDNIAEAHHNTVESISAFFKNYIIVMSLPVTAAVVFFRPGETSNFASWLLSHKETYLILGFLPMVVGLMILGYVINLRCDALLYARAVNGIRNYFSEQSSLDESSLTKYIILPRDAKRPPYFETTYFIFVVITFAVIGTAYLFVGMYLFWEAKFWSKGFWFFAILIIALGAHFVMYMCLTGYRERVYLR